MQDNKSGFLGIEVETSTHETSTHEQSTVATELEGIFTANSQTAFAPEEAQAAGGDRAKLMALFQRAAHVAGETWNQFLEQKGALATITTLKQRFQSFAEKAAKPADPTEALEGFKADFTRMVQTRIRTQKDLQRRIAEKEQDLNQTKQLLRIQTIGMTGTETAVIAKPKDRNAVLRMFAMSVIILGIELLLGFGIFKHGSDSAMGIGISLAVALAYCVLTWFNSHTLTVMRSHKVARQEHEENFPVQPVTRRSFLAPPVQAQRPKLFQLDPMTPVIFWGTLGIYVLISVLLFVLRREMGTGLGPAATLANSALIFTSAVFWLMESKWAPKYEKDRINEWHDLFTLQTEIESDLESLHQDLNNSQETFNNGVLQLRNQFGTQMSSYSNGLQREADKLKREAEDLIQMLKEASAKLISLYRALIEELRITALTGIPDEQRPAFTPQELEELFKAAVGQTEFTLEDFGGESKLQIPIPETEQEPPDFTAIENQISAEVELAEKDVPPPQIAVAAQPPRLSPVTPIWSTVTAMKGAN